MKATQFKSAACSEYDMNRRSGSPHGATGREHPETPAAEDIYNKLATKFLPRQSSSDRGEDSDDSDSDNDQAASSASISTFEDTTDDGNTQANQRRAPNNQLARVKSAANSKASSTTHDSDSSDSIIMSLPKSFAPSKVLQDLGLRFKESGSEVLLIDGVTSDQAQEIIDKACAVIPAELRAITSDVLSAALTQDHLAIADKQTHGTVSNFEAAREPSNTADLPPVGPFEEHLLYERCGSISVADFHHRLASWADGTNLNDSTAPNSRINGAELDALCEALGYEQEHETDIRTGSDVDIVPMDGWLYGELLNGLRCILRFYIPDAKDDSLGEEQAKLLTAILALMKSLDSALVSGQGKVYIFVLRRLVGSVTRLINIVKDFDLYAVTSAKVLSSGRRPAEEHRDQLKCIATALLLTSRIISELPSLAQLVEADLKHREKSLVTNDSEQKKLYDYRHVNECCDPMILSSSAAEGLLKVMHTPDSAQLSVLQTLLDKGVERLEEMGREPGLARFLLINEYQWTRIQQHANAAFESLRSGFKSVLTFNESAKIHYKAAALPTDVMALLLPKILWRPIIGDQDALDMYNQYVTDLVSAIGDWQFTH